MIGGTVAYCCRSLLPAASLDNAPRCAALTRVNFLENYEAASEDVAAPVAPLPRRTAPPLAGENERRKAIECIVAVGERRFVGITRNLAHRQIAPATRGEWVFMDLSAR